MALPCRQREPFHRLSPIRCHTLANCIAEPQIVLGLGVILLSSFATPLYCQHYILHHSFAFGVADAQIVLCLGVILLGGFEIPLYALYIVPRCALTIGVAEA